MFYLKYFKNFEHAELDDERPVTLLIGPNGAGKSNFIEAIELLSFLAAGHPLHEVTDIGRGGGLEVRGGLDACASFGHDTFTLGHRSKVSIDGEDREADYQISVRVGKEPRVASEFLRIQGRDKPVFEVSPSPLRGSGDNTVYYDEHYPRRRKKRPSWTPADRSALSQYSRFAYQDKKLAETLQIVDAVLNGLIAPAVFDPIPSLMRNYERDTEGRLARNGFNISPVLYQLHRTPDRPMNDLATIDSKLEATASDARAVPILERIAQLPDEPFQGFDFITTDAGDVMFGFKTPHSDKPVTARVLSDGTLRALGILTALETSPKGTHLVLEELDNGVHPSRVHLLSEALFDCAGRHGLHVLATTQNPATLNALTAEQLGSVLLVVPDKSKKFARLLPIKELPGYIEFVEQGRLGDLITRRVYERHLGTDYEAERKQDIERWIEALP